MRGGGLHPRPTLPGILGREPVEERTGAVTVHRTGVQVVAQSISTPPVPIARQAAPGSGETTGSSGACGHYG
jgi:hypothetical protein